jgi:DNA replication protein DnaC
MRCYAEDYCKKDKSSCSEVCGGYRVLRALYSLSRIPVKYQYKMDLIPDDRDMQSFIALNKFKEDVVANVESGTGLYIWSANTGNGKTSWACKIMGYYFRKIAFSSGLENEGLYIYLPTFLDDLRNSYNNPSAEFDEELEMVKNCKLLIIDDIGAERVTEWVRERLVSIINTRVSNNLCTIYTSNLSLKGLADKLGDERISSRIKGSVTEINLLGKDNRGAEL